MNLIKGVLTGMMRNLAMSIASLFLIFLTMSVLGVMVIITANTTEISKDVVQSLQMHVYLNSDISEDQRIDIEKQLKENPKSKNVTYSSKDEQLKLVMDGGTFDESDSSLINEYFSGDKNPLNSVYYIEPIAGTDMDQFKTELESIPNVDSADYGQEDGAKGLIKAMKSIQYGAFAIVIFLSAVTILLIINTLRLTIDARKKEIEIMRLVGATKGYITLPFAIEGLIFGIIGSFFAFVCVTILYDFITKGAMFKSILIAPSQITMILLFTQLLFGILIGLLSSLITIRRYLKV